MNNESSTDLKMTMTTMDVKYQLVCPINHRGGDSERDIQTFKTHFIAGLFSIDKFFQFQLWEILLHQENISLNLLRESIIHPHLSAYTHIFGKFN